MEWRCRAARALVKEQEEDEFELREGEDGEGWMMLLVLHAEGAVGWLWCCEREEVGKEGREKQDAVRAAG